MAHALLRNQGLALVLSLLLSHLILILQETEKLDPLDFSQSCSSNQTGASVMLRNERCKEEKASKLDENMPQFSVLSFMASDKFYYDPTVIARSTAFSELNPLDLPSCLVYQGYHEFGYHLFRIKAEEYEKAADMDTKAIINCICKIVGDENVVVTYEDTKGNTAYLNSFHSKEVNIFQELCVRLREQLLRIVLHKPSWYVQFWQENDVSELFKVSWSNHQNVKSKRLLLF